MARCQRALYRRLFAPGGGLDLLARQTGRLCLSLPQYFRRLFAGVAPRGGPQPALRVFTLPQLTPVQHAVLKALGGLGEVALYDFNSPRPLAACAKNGATWSRPSRRCLMSLCYCRQVLQCP